MSQEIPRNIVDVTVKQFDKHMVVSDYRIYLASNDDSVDNLMNKIPQIREKIEVKK